MIETFTRKAKVYQKYLLFPGEFQEREQVWVQEVQDWMRSVSGDGEAWLFPASRKRKSGKLSPVGQNNYRNRILKPAAEKAGIPEMDLLTLRRTCATHFGQRANTKDTQVQMRHSDPVTTLKYYQQSIPESVKKAAVALEAEILTVPDTGKVHKRPRRSKDRH